MGNGFQQTGKIYSVGATQEFTSKTPGKAPFRKRPIILIVGSPQYPKYAELEVTGDRCDELDRFNEGDQVTVEFSLDGRLKAKGDGCFNSLRIWSISHAADGQGQRQQHRESRAPTGNPGPSNTTQRPSSSGPGNRRGPSHDEPPPPGDDDLFGGRRGGYTKEPDDDLPF